MKDSEKNWHAWSSYEFIQWVSLQAYMSSFGLRQLHINSFYGALLPKVTINDLLSLGLNIGEANRLFEAIQQLMRENDGGFTRREELRMKRYNSECNEKSYSSTMLQDLYNPVTQLAKEQNNDYENLDLKQMQGQANKLMREKFGLTLPSLHTNETDPIQINVEYT